MNGSTFSVIISNTNCVMSYSGDYVIQNTRRIVKECRCYFHCGQNSTNDPVVGCSSS